MAHTFPVSTVDQGFGRWLALPQGGLRHQWIRVGASSPPVAAGDVLAAIGGDSKPAVRTIGGRSDHRRRMWPAASRDNVRRGGLSSHEDKGRGGSCACAHKKRRLLMQPPSFPRAGPAFRRGPCAAAVAAFGLRPYGSAVAAFGLRPYASAVAAFGLRPYGSAVAAFGRRPSQRHRRVRREALRRHRRRVRREALRRRHRRFRREALRQRRRAVGP